MHAGGEHRGLRAKICDIKDFPVEGILFETSRSRASRRCSRMPRLRRRDRPAGRTLPPWGGAARPSAPVVAAPPWSLRNTSGTGARGACL